MPEPTPVEASEASTLGTLFPRRPLWRRLWVWLALALLGLAGLTGWGFWQEWNRVGDLEASGGLYFVKRVALPVPIFRQGDERWRDDLLGPTPGTLGAEGCAVSSAAMVMAYYGLDTDPQRLNRFLNEHQGYTPEGWIYWEKAPELQPGLVRHVYEAPGSYRMLDECLLHGDPVIVKLRLPGGSTHFVVVAGKDGRNYLTCDPGAGGARGLYPLRELRSPILGLRYYERLDLR